MSEGGSYVPSHRTQSGSCGRRDFIRGTAGHVPGAERHFPWRSGRKPGMAHGRNLARHHPRLPRAGSEDALPARALEFIQDELDTAALYDALSETAGDARLATVYTRLAATERRHADHWIAQLRAAGE